MKRGAELIGMLEKASIKIDRFGWDRMDDGMKDALCADWVRVLSVFRLQEVSDAIDQFLSDRGGNVKSINEFQIKDQIEANHKKVLASLPSRPNIPKSQMRPSLSDEEMAARREQVADAWPKSN